MPSRYFVPSLLEPIRSLKQRYLEARRPVPRAPKHVQIQTISGCNANCVFCPNQKTEIDIPMGKRMDWDLYRSIVDQVTALPVRRISPYLMNEPLLDPEMPERVAYITAKKTRRQHTKINSHGQMCHERMAKGLLDAGLDEIHFSVQGIDPVIYEKIMGLKFATVTRNVERMVQLRNEGRYRTEIHVIMLDTVEVSPQRDQVFAYWQERGVDEIRFNQLENRGHHRNIQAEEIAVRQLEPFDWCERMFNQMYILHDGRAVQCCADWEQSAVMGDLKVNRLENVWKGLAYTNYRKRFLKGDVKGMLCDGCTKDGGGDGEDD